MIKHSWSQAELADMNRELLLDPRHWLRCAKSLMTAVLIIDAATEEPTRRVWAQDEPPPTGLEMAYFLARAPNTMLMANLLECVLKGLICREGTAIDGHHRLRKLWRQAYPNDPRDGERDARLEELEKMVYLGRYPASFKFDGKQILSSAIPGSYASFSALIERPFDDLHAHCDRMLEKSAQVMDTS